VEAGAVEVVVAADVDLWSVISVVSGMRICGENLRQLLLVSPEV
jgi:hypothetical protein